MRRSTLSVTAVCLIVVLGAGWLFSSEPPGDRSSKWRPLFDGKTLAGWHPIGQGRWTMEDGVIFGRHDAKDDFGHLVSDKSYTDFTVRLKFKSLKGNSGLYFRIKPEGFSGVSGFQAEIDPRKDIGGLYETNGRSWVAQPKPEDVKKYFKPDEWNEMIVSAHGRDIAVWINGTQTADLKNDLGPFVEGPFALQVHGGQEGLVMFKDIEMLDESAAVKR